MTVSPVLTPNPPLALDNVANATRSGIGKVGRPTLRRQGVHSREWCRSQGALPVAFFGKPAAAGVVWFV